MIPAPLISYETPRRDRTRQDETPARIPVGEARDAQEAALETIRQEILAWHKLPEDGRPEPLQSGIKITAGTGKSTSIRNMIASFVPEAKEAGLPYRVLYLVPTHGLGEEARQRVSPVIPTALWQGRLSNKVSTGEPMCLNHGVVKAAIALGLNVEGTACKQGENKCQFHGECLYQKQKKSAREADVVFAAHEIGFDIPKALGGGFGLVVIDEGFWAKGLKTKSRLAIAGLAREIDAFPVRAKGGRKNEFMTEHLRELLDDRLIPMLSALPDGYVPRQSLIDAGLMPVSDIDPGSCSIAIDYERGRELHPGLHPGSSKEKIREAKESFKFLGQIKGRISMWEALDDLIESDQDATGRLWIETETDTEGSVRYLHIHARVDLNDDIISLPIIHADATLIPEITRHYLPRLEIRLDIEVDAPHETVTQVIGLPVGKSSLQAIGPGTRAPNAKQRREGEEERVGDKRQRLRTAVERLTRGKRGLVITYQNIEDDFANIDGVETAHFGATEGIDRWGEIDVLITIGRWLPSGEDIQKMAAALTGKPVIAEKPVWVPGAARLKNGTDHILPARKGRKKDEPPCLKYADPDAEMIRQAVSEAQLLQNIGRPRGVNRTANNPVDILFIADDLTLPVAIDAVIDFKDLEPTRIDKMIDAGIFTYSPSDAAKLYPGLFKSHKAARNDYSRSGLTADGCSEGVPNAYRDIYISRWDTFRVKYRRKARGRVLTTALVHKSQIDGLREHLEAALGPLELFVLIEIDQTPALDPPPPETPRTVRPGDAGDTGEGGENGKAGDLEDLREDLKRSRPESVTFDPRSLPVSCPLLAAGAPGWTL